MNQDLDLRKKFTSTSLLFLVIPMVLSAFTHLWNPIGFPAVHLDEGIYLRRAMHVLEGLGPQEADFRYDHPYFGQIFLAGVLGLVGFPNSVVASPSSFSSSSAAENVHSIEMLYLVPRVLMGILAIVDTFLVYKIADFRYNRNVAFIAAILFAVMPLTWLMRRILLDSILLPFLLSSILFSIYIRRNPIKNSRNNVIKTSNDHQHFHRNKIAIILISGVLLGVAIFTKIPAFTMIPLVGFLIYTNSGRSLRALGLWFIPVIAIPLIWPAYAISVGQLDQWIDGIFWQAERQNKPLSDAYLIFFQIDPVLLILGIAGIILAVLKRDLFIVLATIPFLIFLYGIGYVSHFHWIPVFPAFCIAGGNLIIYLSGRIDNKKLQRLLPFATIAAIGIFGLVSTTILITTNVSSFQMEAAAFVSNYLDSKFGKNSNITILSSPMYSWIMMYVFDYDEALPTYKKSSSVNAKKTLIMYDKYFKNYISDDSNGKAVKNRVARLLALYENSTMIAVFRGTASNYDFDIYPYGSMRQNLGGTTVEIRTNY
jgi:4-amino-4-deoxy-L-arabinose transferase-like glycosyltransferase